MDWILLFAALASGGWPLFVLCCLILLGVWILMSKEKGD